MSLVDVFNEIIQFINIDEDRETYTKNFDIVRTQLFSILKENQIFKLLFNKFQIAGSYGDNLKVNMPDEFDLVFYLKFPDNDSIIVRKDNQIPGNVFLDMTILLDNIMDKPHLKSVYCLLRGFVNEHNLLITDKLQSWLQSLVKRALNKLDSIVMVDSKITRLFYKISGPAHTIEVNANLFKYSIDFVPAILLSPAQSVLNGNLKNNYDWEAIPKPIKPFKKDNTSFRSSYYNLERSLLKDNDNFKSALRIMKKFRDCHPNMNNLKSYYIKTLFLLKNEENGMRTSYWQQPLHKIVTEMFSYLESFLSEGNIPYYWDRNCNMLENLSKHSIKCMLRQVCVVRSTLLFAKLECNEIEKKILRKLFITKNDVNLKRHRLSTDYEYDSVINDDDLDESELCLKELFHYYNQD